MYLFSEYGGTGYNYEVASAVQSYVVMVYKGFNVISAQNYELVVPETYPEICFAVVCVFLQIILASYILGTINHYLVKKDERVEAFRRQLQALEVYCAQRKLPESLQQRLRAYFEFQQSKRRDDDSKIMRALSATLRMKVAGFQARRRLGVVAPSSWFPRMPAPAPVPNAGLTLSV